MLFKDHVESKKFVGTGLASFFWLYLILSTDGMAQLFAMGTIGFIHVSYILGQSYVDRYTGFITNVGREARDSEETARVSRRDREDRPSAQDTW